ncbi:hypothetical protein KIPB_004262 [Kipferlia bialata]|uniref:Uncharacterized protein n=1 Tax=Kipferlia bialata TaxID=797122 RepID=A0A391P1W6_9EUKA|nr:hypothetical protein KIPB_004262 [Kipferlia bialata]|eukprot:g4262.t1
MPADMASVKAGLTAWVATYVDWNARAKKTLAQKIAGFFKLFALSLIFPALILGSSFVIHGLRSLDEKLDYCGDIYTDPIQATVVSSCILNDKDGVEWENPNNPNLEELEPTPELQYSHDLDGETLHCVVTLSSGSDTYWMRPANAAWYVYNCR